MSAIPFSDPCAGRRFPSIIQPTARYPSSVATDDDLMIAGNSRSTVLRSSAGPGDTLLTVADGTAAIPDMLFTVGQEIVKVEAVSGNNWTVVRGFDGTFAVSHSAGRTISALVDAWHHNALAAEVKAIQTALGVNLSNLDDNPGESTSTAYDWPYQTPGGDLVVGNNSITLTPVPLGVNGTANLDHYVYISGGTGAAEACLITGGSAVSGAPTGTLIIQCANTHSGPWTVRSSSAGIQEAIYALGPAGGRVYIPAGNHPITGQVSIRGKNGVLLDGSARGGTTLTCSATSKDCIYVSGSYDVTIQNLSIVGSGKTTGWAVSTIAAGRLIVENLTIQSMPNGIWLFLVTVGWVNRISIIDTPGGHGILIFGGGDHVITSIVHDNGTGNAYAGIAVQATGGAFLSHLDMIRCDNGLLVNPPDSALVVALVVHHSYFDTGGAGITISPVGVVSPGVPSIVNCRFTDCWTCGHERQGVMITGIVQGVRFHGHMAQTNGQDGMLLAQTGDVEVSGSWICASSQSTPGGYSDIRIVTDNCRIQNNTIGGPFLESVDKSAYAVSITAGGNALVLTGNRVHAGSSGTINDTTTSPSKVIAGNIGASDDAFTLASAATLTLPSYYPDVIFLTGTTAVNTITGGYQHRRITFLKTDPGSVIFQFGNIAGMTTLAQSGRVDAMYDANFSLWFLK